MKTNKRKTLSLAISALLTAGVVSYPVYSYAKDDSETKTKVESKKADSAKAASASGSDSDKRSDSGSGDKSKQKITICHVPPGNPENKHTLHIAFSAWKAHQAHTNNKGPDYVDYLGSCNSKTDTTPKETMHVISGCKGETREALETKVQSFYDPITVADTALDDETIVTAMSQCLDKGDSSDSGKSGGDSSKSTSGGKGRGHDSVSDSGNHHRIRGCLNKDSGHQADSTDSSKHGLSDSDKSDSNKNYHTKLKSADSAHDTAKGIKDPVVVSDSSQDDSGVWKALKACVKDSSNPDKIDSSKTGKKRGDSGHKQFILKDHDSVSDSGKQLKNSCTAEQDTTLRTALSAYKAKTTTKDIVLTQSSYDDVAVKQLVDACVSSGAKDMTTDTFSPTVAIHNVAITGATITNAVVTGGVISSGTITAGTSSTANVVGGTITAGTVTGGTTSGTTITGATISGATVSTGISGRLNFRDVSSPIKESGPTGGTLTCTAPQVLQNNVCVTP